MLSNVVLAAFAQDRPNILVLSIEDTSWFEFPAYGNQCVQTPNLDKMASDGVVFQYAYSNGPQSSPARSGLITGAYASTYAMEQHRSSPATPAGIFYPQLLRDAGYYCTNNAKTDYNTTTDNKICWDECNNKASYNSAARPANKPFFAVFNSGITHMGRIRSYHTDGRRDFTKDGIFVDNAPLPAHLPDIPEVRSDYAFHLEGVKDVDAWVGLFINDLKKRGLYENTIIFFFSDHGGCSPRGKGYLYETGLRVPMIVYVPEKYKEQYGINPETGNKPVCFVDLAPTFLQIAGVQAPERYQGESFFKPLDGRTKYQYGVCGNQATHFQPLRSVSDGRWKYIRRFIPYKQHALRNYYQWGMPGNIAWDSIYQKNQTNNITALPFQNKYAEELFDLSVDPFETNNLAYHPDFVTEKESMRQKIDEFVTGTVDLGYLLPMQREKKNNYNLCRAVGYPLAQLHRLANLTCRVETSDLPELTTALTSTYQEIRFWAVVNIAQLAVTGKISVAPTGLIGLLNDASQEVAAEAAYALCYLGEKETAMSYYMNLVRSRQNYHDAVSMLEVLSLDERANEFFTPAIISELKTYTPVKNYASQKDLGIMIRGVLANLKEYPANQIYDQPVYDEGLSVNKTRRPLNPAPGGSSTSEHFFLENFKPLDGQSKVPLTDMVGKTDVAGWLCSPTGVFAQNSSTLAGGIRISSTTSTLAWIETPELDLSKPVLLEFESKKWVKEGEGTLYGVVDGDTIIYVMNPNNTISPRKSTPFVAGEKSRIRFTGTKVASNDICIDSIRVSYTDEPMLSIPYSKVVDMGDVKPGHQLNYSLPVSVQNGYGTVSFQQPDNELFSISGESVIAFSDEINDSQINFVFNAPEQPGTYTSRVSVDGGEDYGVRTVWLNATVDPASDTKKVLDKNLKILIRNREISIYANEMMSVKLYAVSGQMLSSVVNSNTYCTITAPGEGLFLLNITGVSGSVIRKVIVN